jgi:trigger factor
MKLRSQKREGNKVFLEVEEDYSRFEEAFQKTLEEAGKEIKLPGFRPGKAPRDMIERAINREAIAPRAAQNLIAEIYPQILDTAKIDPVDYPNVEIVQQEKEKPLVFKLSIDVYPEVKLGKYKGVKLEKKSAEVSEQEVLNVLGKLQERFAVTKEGKKELLPLDDEFAKKVSRYGTLAELKEEIRKALQNDKIAEVDADLKNKAIAAVSAEAKVDIPSAMIEREIGVMLDELKTSLAQSRLTLEDYLRGAKKEEKALREEMRKSAEIRVKGKMVLKAVAEAERLAVSPEEIKAEVKSLAGSIQQTPEEFEKNMEENAKRYIEDYLLRNKALSFLIEKASIKMKEEKK